MRTILLCSIVLSFGCGSRYQTGAVEQNDAGIDTGSSSTDFCPPLACGLIEGHNCGNCEMYPNAVCGDNNKPNVCGESCVSKSNTDVCGNYLGMQFSVPFDGKEYSGDCTTLDINNCVLIDPSLDRICEGACKSVWCCLN